MTHDEYQEEISRLIDNDLHEEESTTLFTHLSTCRECREFIQSSLRLRSGLLADSLSAPVAADRTLQQRFSSSIIPRLKSAQSIWNQRITLRFPVLALLLCLFAAGAVLVFSGRSPFYEPETVYVTRLPAVVITDETDAFQPKN